MTAPAVEVHGLVWLRYGLAWTVHAAVGTVVLAAGAGALLAALALPEEPPATLSA